MPTIEGRLTELELAVTQIEGVVNVPRYMNERLGYEEWVKAKDSLPTFPSGDRNVADRMREIGVSQDALVEQMRQLQADNDQLRARLDAVEARPTGTVQLPPAPPTQGGDVKAQLAAYDIHIIPGKLAIGLEPDPDYDASIQIGGNVAAEILGVSNTRRTDAQNPDEVHKNVLSIAGNDGGFRMLQYLGWGPTGKKRNTLNRRASILALDSQGDLCKSTEDVGATSDGGQSWYIRTNGNIVEFCTYKVGAFIRILKSVAQYGATDSQQL